MTIIHQSETVWGGCPSSNSRQLPGLHDLYTQQNDIITNNKYFFFLKSNLAEKYNPLGNLYNAVHRIRFAYIIYLTSLSIQWMIKVPVGVITESEIFVNTFYVAVHII